MNSTDIMQKSVNREKRYLKPGIVMTALLVIMSSYPPLSTDMYLPALPGIAALFQTSISHINLTLVLFFIFFALSTLLWGPISDRFGRKPALLTGIALYIIASIGCMFSQSVSQLIVFRVLQAVGSGAPVTISIAIVQDLYAGVQKKRIFSILSALMMVAPVIAPLLGSLVLSVANWRIVFLLLSILGIISFIGGVFIPETNRYKTDKSVLKSFTGVFIVMKEPFFRKAVFVFSLPALVVLGFVGGSPSILMTGFGVSKNIFTVYFASNAVFAIIGSLLYVPFSKKINSFFLATISFSITLASGIGIVFFGGRDPLVFMLCVIPATLSMALIRPLGMNLLMAKSGHDAGSASAVMNFLFIFAGSISMELISLDWPSRTFIFAILTLTTGSVCLVSWYLLGNVFKNKTGEAVKKD